MASVTGRLQVVATPIGNLADLSDRAREALAGADVIAAEDTRHTAALLKAHGIAHQYDSLSCSEPCEQYPDATRFVVLVQ